MLSEFTDSYKERPAKVFTSTREATAFTALLARLEIPYRIQLRNPPKRLNLPMETVVILLGRVPDAVH
jgi:hypothetical protein